MHPSIQAGGNEGSPRLIRGVGLGSATALNMIDMIGVGPFITIPLILSAMGGPQAMLGWIFGALFAVCDGLVWAELGAAMPGSGGSYRYLREIYGPHRLGRLISFLFIWQLSFSAPLSIASGSIGLASYASYLWPRLENQFVARNWSMQIPVLGTMQVRWIVSGATFIAIGVVLLVVILLYRKITSIGWMSKLLWLGVMGTIGWIIFAGLTHFNASQAFSFPPGAFHLSHGFFLGLGSAMLIATYDYWGYYNVSFLGDEVKDPEKTIPRALLLSILIVACLYVVMNICILGVVPWQEITGSGQSNRGLYVISIFMARVYGPWAAKLATCLVMWAAFASVFSLLLGYSRVPYAAALDGNYFRAFARVHPQHRFPYVSLVALGGTAMLFCFFSLADVIAALVVIRITLQFLMQAIGLIVLRIRRPDLPRPFRMWLYPLPALIAILGFFFILVYRVNSLAQIRYALVIVLTGTVIFMARSWRNREWPFGNAVPVPAAEVSSS
ncbi:MAG: amino acid/polyamine/organocation transporter, superfamily [Acidobacteriaceae bacterium]|nr:amino acid/polyamine/organocation transporter, superfamily [Acidobacteriaceae bacterium]